MNFRAGFGERRHRGQGVHDVAYGAQPNDQDAAHRSHFDGFEPVRQALGRAPGHADSRFSFQLAPCEFTLTQMAHRGIQVQFPA